VDLGADVLDEVEHLLLEAHVGGQVALAVVQKDGGVAALLINLVGICFVRLVFYIYLYISIYIINPRRYIHT
jgi:hypothetical protein